MVRFAESTKPGPALPVASFRSTVVEQSTASGGARASKSSRTSKDISTTKSKSGKSRAKFKPDNNLGIPNVAKEQFAAQTSVRRASKKIKSAAKKRLDRPKLRHIKSYKDKPWLGAIAMLLIALVCLLLYSLMAEKPQRNLCTRADCTCVDLAEDGTSACPEAGRFPSRPQPLLGVAYYYVKPEKQNTSDPFHQLCYAIPNPEAAEETIAVDYQPIYPDFDPLESCVIEQSLYSVLMETRAFYWYFYVTVVMIVVTTAALSLALLFPALIIWTSHGIAAAALWGAFIAAAAMLSGFAFIWFFLAFCHLVYFALTKQRIPDLNLLLIAAVAIITRKKGILVVAYTSAILQAGIFVVWGYIWVTVNGRLTWAVDLICFLLFFWASQLFKYLAHTIIAGSTASWYYGKAETQATLNSTLRAFTTSLGSVAYGSLMMATFKLLRVVSSALRVSGNLLEALCGGCMIAIEAVMRQFNIYGFTLVAVYGYSFNHASARSFKLLTDNNMRGMMLDDIVATTVVIGGIGMGAIGVASCWLGLQLGLAPGYEDYNFAATLFIPSFVLGFMVGFVVLEVLESIITTIYTCFAEEPRVLEATDRTLYQELKEQWYAGMVDSDSDEPVKSDEEESDQHSVSSGFSDDELQDGAGDEEWAREPAFEHHTVAVATMVAHTKRETKTKKKAGKQGRWRSKTGEEYSEEDEETGFGGTIPIPGVPDSSAHSIER